MTQKITGVYRNLPGIKSLRDEFRLTGQTGVFTRYIKTFKSAYADYTKDGKCTGIYCYGYQEPMAERHYYCKDGSANISDTIEKYMTGEITRSEAAQEIAEAISDTIADRAEE